MQNLFSSLIEVNIVTAVPRSVYFNIEVFQNSGENFLDQQFWLYLYGLLVASLVHLVSSPDFSPLLILHSLSSISPKVQLFLVLGLTFSSIGGLVVAAILKRLDNVVKEYSSATANMFTAVLSALLFPDKFEITVFILLAMALLFTGIYLYEKKSFSRSEESQSDTKENIKSISST